MVVSLCNQDPQETLGTNYIIDNNNAVCTLNLGQGPAYSCNMYLGTRTLAEEQVRAESTAMYAACSPTPTDMEMGQPGGRGCLFSISHENRLAGQAHF